MDVHGKLEGIIENGQAIYFGYRLISAVFNGG